MLLGAFAVVMIGAALRHWELGDLQAYLGAAERLRHGEALYPASYDPNGSATFRYAPWFAGAFIPISYLPEQVVRVAWSTVLVASIAYVTYRLMIRGTAGLALALVVTPMLAVTAAYGNVQPLLVGLLMWPGIVSVAVAGSLKLTPILFVAAWRRWQRIAATVALAAVLWLPALWSGVENYPTDPGSALIAGPLWIHVVLAIGLIVVAQASGRYRALVAAIAVLAALPRFHLYDTTFLVMGVGAVDTLRDRCR